MTDARAQGEGLTLAVSGPTCIAIWSAKPTRATFERQSNALRDTVDRFPGEATFLCIVEEDAEAPDEELRKASTRMIDGLDGKLRRVACVIEGSGFHAAITRTVLSGMGLVVRSRVPVRYVSTVAEAATWLCGATSAEAVTDLRNTVAQLRAAQNRPVE